jgi:hypothetical protein
MRKLDLQDEPYFQYIGEGKYSECGELTGTYIVLGDFHKGQFSIVQCPFENSCFLIVNVG